MSSSSADDLFDDRVHGDGIPAGQQIDLGPGNDTFILFTGRYGVRGGQGNDLIQVSGFRTIVDYSGSPAGIVFNDSNGLTWVDDGWGTRDTLLGQSWAIGGSNFGDQFWISSSGSQVASYGGEDKIYAHGDIYVAPGSGDDLISGDGFTLSYTDANTPINAALSVGIVSDGLGSEGYYMGAGRSFLEISL